MELSERHFGRRLLAFVICLAAAVAALGYGIHALITTDPGWVTIEASNGVTHCGGDFVFRYFLEEEGAAGTQRMRQVQALYNEMTVKGYQLFTPAEELEGVRNLYYINTHPNEDIVVDPVLYQAFETAEEYGDRSVYLGPVYAQYSDLLYCQEDVDAAYYDPYTDPEAAAFCQKLAAFAADPQEVRVELLGENTLRLQVSEEYLRYAGEQGGLRFLDFAWQTNAYVIDYFARSFQEQGITTGDISSVDGFSRSLFQGEGQALLTLYAWEGGKAVEAAQAELPIGESLVNLRAFPLGDMDGYYYVMENGGIRHQYVDISDGLCKASADALTVYARDKSCAQLMLEAGPVFIAGELDLEALSQLEKKGIDSIAIKDRAIYHSDAALPLSQLYRGYRAISKK